MFRRVSREERRGEGRVLRGETKKDQINRKEHNKAEY